MKVKINYLIITAAIFIIGVFVGYSYDLLRIKNTQLLADLSFFEFSSLLVRGIAAVFTLLAVIVALFKEDIRKIWEYSDIQVNLSSAGFKEIQKKQNENISGNALETIRVDQYCCDLHVINKGNITAISNEILIEGITFKGVNFPKPITVDINQTKLTWIGGDEERVDLPRNTLRKSTILSIHSPESVSPPGETNLNPKSHIIIGKNRIINHGNGTYEIEFIVSGNNNSPIRYLLALDWNGQWANRKMEMDKHIHFKLNSK